MPTLIPSFASIFPENRWLEQRLLQDDPNFRHDFARKGTTSWMRALALLVEGGFDHDTLSARYHRVQRRSPVGFKADTNVFAFTFMSLQNLSAIKATLSTEYVTDLSRSSIVSWYYGVYYAASAMVAACLGSVQEDHAGTARAWENSIAKHGLTVSPFDLRLTTLVKDGYETEVSAMKGANSFALPNRPTNREEALGAHLSYLKNTAKGRKEAVEKQVKRSKEFKAAGYTDFRKKGAREMRDKALKSKGTCFLHEAFRYRGKANYRDPLYLGYAVEDTEELEALTQDLFDVLSAFLRMACYFCARRVEKGTWEEFVADVDRSSVLLCHSAYVRVDGKS